MRHSPATAYGSPRVATEDITINTGVLEPRIALA
jgi:hypothetical protein